MNKRYENKSAYDPGRFRFKLNFFRQTGIPDGAGGSIVSYIQAGSSYAAQEKISEGDQIALDAGITALNQDCYFVVRYRASFVPEKDMVVYMNGQTYVVRAIIPIDVPINYIKLLCVKKDYELTT